MTTPAPKRTRGAALLAAMLLAIRADPVLTNIDAEQTDAGGLDGGVDAVIRAAEAAIDAVDALAWAVDALAAVVAGAAVEAAAEAAIDAADIHAIQDAAEALLLDAHSAAADSGATVVDIARAAAARHPGANPP